MVNIRRYSLRTVKRRTLQKPRKTPELEEFEMNHQRIQKISYNSQNSSIMNMNLTKNLKKSNENLLTRVKEIPVYKH